VCVLLIGLSVVPAWAAPPASGQIVHIVRWGENLSGIAVRYGTTTHAIMSANGLSNPNWIYAGQRLIIPGTGHGYQPQPSTCGQVYMVRYGDTLSGIAYRFGISASALMQANGIVNPNCIYAGQKLTIPCGSQPVYPPKPVHPIYPPKPVHPVYPPKPVHPIYPPQPDPHPPVHKPVDGRWYVVKPGDTLAKIAWRFGVNMWAIVKVNNIPNPNVIHVGQKLFIPSSMVHPKPKPKPATPGCEHMLWPRAGETLYGQIHAKGTADVENFWYYKLEYRKDGLDNWHYITGKEEPVHTGVLGMWDTHTVPDGSYTFRLVVVDGTGNYPPPCEIPVYVKNHHYHP
jgi:LysM repeat protein